MQLWMWQEKRHVEEGTVVYVVSWRVYTQAALARQAEQGSDYDHDYDADDIERAREFPNVVAARRYAKTIRKKDNYGCPEVSEYHAQQDEYAPRGIGEWVLIGEPEVID